jgi:hypothetical protein
VSHFFHTSTRFPVKFIGKNNDSPVAISQRLIPTCPTNDALKPCQLEGCCLENPYFGFEAPFWQEELF